MNFTWTLKDATLRGQENESYAQATGLPSNMNNEYEMLRLPFIQPSNSPLSIYWEGIKACSHTKTFA